MAKTSDRFAHVTITADVSDYIAKLEQIRDIVKELKACGVDVKDIPAAITTVEKIDAENLRTRILAEAHDTEPWEYDLAVDLGYEPESWDGMWKLPLHPFTYDGSVVLVREVITDENHKAYIGSGDSALICTREFALPEGWHSVEDRRLTDPEPSYRLISPRQWERFTNSQK